MKKTANKFIKNNIVITCYKAFKKPTKGKHRCNHHHHRHHHDHFNHRHHPLSTAITESVSDPSAATSESAAATASVAYFTTTVQLRVHTSSWCDTLLLSKLQGHRTNIFIFIFCIVPVVKCFAAAAAAAAASAAAAAAAAAAASAKLANDAWYCFLISIFFSAKIKLSKQTNGNVQRFSSGFWAHYNRFF